MKKKTSTAMVLFVLIVVILSVVFTWKALDYSSESNAQKTASAENAGFSSDLVTEGTVGINLVSKTKEGT